MDDRLTIEILGKTFEIDVAHADFATRRELLQFAMVSKSVRGYAALCVEFLRAPHPARKSVPLFRDLSLERVPSAFKLGGAAWERLADQGWSDEVIISAGVAVFRAVQGQQGASKQDVTEAEHFSSATKAGGTSSPIESPPTTDSPSSGFAP